MHSKDGKPRQPRWSGHHPLLPLRKLRHEDPAHHKIGNTYYITYVAVSPFGISTGLMSTIDFKSFRRHGLIFCPDNKDVVLFPEKVMGEYVALHRPAGSMRFSPPEVWLARSPDLIHWGTHTRLLGADQSTLQDRASAGTPPIRTREGWLAIYHRSEKSHSDAAVGVYSGHTIMLDLDNPAKIIGHWTSPSFRRRKVRERRLRR
ncbi:MAG: hypothetical protein R3C45_11050 [Phycisphaerales bacterium]